MAYDALLALQSLVTKTATFNGTGLSLPNGTPPRGLVARVPYSVSAGSGTTTATFSVDYTPDAGSTWQTLASNAGLTGSTGSSGVAHIPFTTPLSSRGNTSAQVRLTVTIAGGTTPAVAYSGEIGNSMP